MILENNHRQKMFLKKIKKKEEQTREDTKTKNNHIKGRNTK